MPPRQSELPEGTDHIVSGAMNRGRAEDRGGGTSPDPGFIGAGAESDDTGGNADDAEQNGIRNSLAAPLRAGAAQLRQQATERVRRIADDGKTRASDALDEISRAIEDAAGTIDDRLGSDYGGYARKTADAVSGLATTLREREVEELYQDVQNFVRTSPGIAVSVAAVVGFALVRLVKAGAPEEAAEGGSATRKRKGSGKRKSGATASDS